MRAYSYDLRERVLRAVDEGKSRKQIVEFFRVSRATIKRYIRQRREEGHVRPHSIPGRTPKKGAVLRVGVQTLVEAHPDKRLEDYCQMWEEQHGVQVSRSSMSRAIRAAVWTRKKRP